MTIFFIDKWAAERGARLADVGTGDSRERLPTPQVGMTGGRSPEEQNCRRERRDRSPTSPFSPWQCALPWVANPVQQPVESDPKLYVETALEIPAPPAPRIIRRSSSPSDFLPPLLGG